MTAISRIRHRIARAFVCFVVAGLVTLPLSAQAAAPAPQDPGDARPVLQLKGKDKDKDVEQEAEGPEDAKPSSPGNSGNSGSSGNPGNSGPSHDAGNSDNAPGQQRAPEMLPPGLASDGGGASDGTPGHTGVVPAEPNGVAAGMGGGPPVLVPSGAIPTQGGLGTFDTSRLPKSVSAAVLLLRTGDDTVAGDEAEPSPAAAATEIPGGLVSMLEPFIPPVLSDVVASPFIVVEALFEAMVTSGQALIIPFLAGAAGLFAPALRRREIVLAALEGRDSSS